MKPFLKQRQTLLILMAFGILACGIGYVGVRKIGLNRALATIKGPGVIGIDQVNNGSFLKQSDGTLLWEKGFFGIAQPMNWAPYDYIELTFFNRGKEGVSINFEIKDSGSTSYWTYCKRKRK
jgi:hypothetical protein